MAQQTTPNLNLVLPYQSENVEVNDINDNYTKIDTAYGSLSDQIGQFSDVDLGVISAKDGTKSITFNGSVYFLLISYGGSDSRMGMWMVRGTATSVIYAPILSPTHVTLSASGGTLTLTAGVINVNFKALVLGGLYSDIVVGS